MKRKISVVLSALLLALSFASCTQITANSRITSSAGLESYAEFLEMRLGEKLPKSVTLATEADGYAMGEFAPDGYFTRAMDGEVVICGKTADGVDRGVRDFVKNGNSRRYEKTYNEGYRVKKLTVCGRDIGDFTIVKPESSDECMDFAATELQLYIEKTCGAKVEITTDKNVSPSVVFQIGDIETYGDEAFSIEVETDRITITGGRYRGCMYGVYDLIEDDFGWRFINDVLGASVLGPLPQCEIEYLYESEHVDITEKSNRFEKPSVTMRIASDHGTIANDVNHLCQKLKGNHVGRSKAFYKGNPTYGGYGLVAPANHGLQTEIDNTDLYKSSGQICFTLEDNLEAIEERCIAQVYERMEMGLELGVDILSIDVGQLDSFNFCECEDCRKVFYEEGGNSGAIVRMANRLSEALDAEFGEMYPEGFDGLIVCIFAYAGGNDPPKKTRPLDNVKVSYCFYVERTHNVCNNHSIDGTGCDEVAENARNGNRYYAEQFLTWRKITKHLDVWIYPFHNYNVAAPAPLVDVVYDDLRFLIDNGVEGIWSCNDYDTGMSLSPLVSYLECRMMWDGDMTRDEFEAYRAEWLDIVYGDAGVLMNEYFMLLERAGDDNGCWIAFSHKTTSCVNPKTMEKYFPVMCEIFDEAEFLADNVHQANMIEYQKGGMLFAVLSNLYDGWYVKGSEESRASVARMYTEMYRIFKDNHILVYNVSGTSGDRYAPETLDIEKNPLEWYNKD